MVPFKALNTINSHHATVLVRNLIACNTQNTCPFIVRQSHITQHVAHSLMRPVVEDISPAAVQTR